MGTSHKNKVSHYGSFYEYACCYQEIMTEGISHKEKVSHYGFFYEYACCHLEKIVVGTSHKKKVSHQYGFLFDKFEAINLSNCNVP